MRAQEMSEIVPIRSMIPCTTRLQTSDLIEFLPLNALRHAVETVEMLAANVAGELGAILTRGSHT